MSLHYRYDNIARREARNTKKATQDYSRALTLAWSIVGIGILIALFSQILKPTSQTQSSTPVYFSSVVVTSSSSNESSQASSTTYSKTGKIKQFSSQEFVDLYNQLVHGGTQPLSAPPEVTGFPKADAHIRELAQERGYRMRSDVNTPLVKFAVGSDKWQLQSDAADAVVAFIQYANTSGSYLNMISAYRSPDEQRDLFLARLPLKENEQKMIATGQYDEIINTTLSRTAPPGYSRHHTGFTVDFRCGVGDLDSFKSSECFQWISYNNYERAKKFGFTPSYPEGAQQMGPEPESWEYVYVGVDKLME